MLGAVLAALRAGLDLHINWIGRIAVWPTMSAFGSALFGWDVAAEVFLYTGLAGSIAATVQYGVDARRELRARRSA
jgi:cardiolipin synthase (CMP-forming)